MIRSVKHMKKDALHRMARRRGAPRRPSVRFAMRPQAIVKLTGCCPNPRSGGSAAIGAGLLRWTRFCIKVDYGNLQISISQNVDHRRVAGRIDPAVESYLDHASTAHTLARQSLSITF